MYLTQQKVSSACAQRTYQSRILAHGWSQMEIANSGLVRRHIIRLSMQPNRRPLSELPSFRKIITDQLVQLSPEQPTQDRAKGRCDSRWEHHILTSKNLGLFSTLRLTVAKDDFSREQWHASYLINSLSCTWTEANWNRLLTPVSEEAASVSSESLIKSSFLIGCSTFVRIAITRSDPKERPRCSSSTTPYSQ